MGSRSRKLVATTRIGNLPVRIFEQDELVRDDKECYGVTDETDAGVDIILQAGMAPERFHEVFFHELVHAVEMGMGIEIKHSVVNQLGLGLGSAMNQLKWKPGYKRRSKR